MLRPSGRWCWRVLALALVGASVPTAGSMPLLRAVEPAAEPAQEKRERLAVHETLAVLGKVEFRLCRGRTSLCPEKCGHSGNFASFTIKKYLKHEKLGEFGDPKQESFLIQISDFDKRPIGDPKLAKTIQGLKEGDFVLLSWNHDYVTSKGASSPDRPVVKLEKIDTAKAEALLISSE